MIDIARDLVAQNEQWVLDLTAYIDSAPDREIGGLEPPDRAAWEWTPDQCKLWTALCTAFGVVQSADDIRLNTLIDKGWCAMYLRGLLIEIHKGGTDGV